MFSDALVDLDFFDYLVRIRRELHQHPELSREEIETAARVCKELDVLGIPYKNNVGGHGIIAEISGGTSNSFIALRADMDALPIQEETGLSFASKNDGVMHACGHDFHTTALLGAAKLLQNQESLPVSVRLIFQPAEEVAEGALAMIRAGALENVLAIYGGHVDNRFDANCIVIQDGPVGASSDAFRIHITGQGAHGARPQQSVDAVVVGSALVMGLQTIIAREVSPTKPAVVSVGKFSAGSAPNVIAGIATLEGTIRTHDMDVRNQIFEKIKLKAQHTAQAFGATVALELMDRTPVLVNAKDQAALAREAAVHVVGEHGIGVLNEVNMGAEDFGYYLQNVPGAFVRYGTKIPDKESYPAHSSTFDVNEQSLPVAASFLASIAVCAGKRMLADFP